MVVQGADPASCQSSASPLAAADWSLLVITKLRAACHRRLALGGCAAGPPSLHQPVPEVPTRAARPAEEGGLLGYGWGDQGNSLPVTKISQPQKLFGNLIVFWNKSRMLSSHCSQPNILVFGCLDTILLASFLVN